MRRTLALGLLIMAGCTNGNSTKGAAAADASLDGGGDGQSANGSGRDSGTGNTNGHGGDGGADAGDATATQDGGDADGGGSASGPSSGAVVAGDTVKVAQVEGFSRERLTAAALTDGTYLLFYSAPTPELGILASSPFGQRLSSSGTPMGEPFMIDRIGDDVGIPEYHASSLPDGGFLLAWREMKGFDLNVLYVRHFDADGTPRGDATTVFDQSVDDGFQWTGFSAAPDGSAVLLVRAVRAAETTLVARRLTSAGELVSPEQVVWPAINAFPSEGSLISWPGGAWSVANALTVAEGIVLHHTDADGDFGAPITLNPEDLRGALASGAALEDKRAVYVWSYTPIGAKETLRVRTVNFETGKLSKESIVNSSDLHGTFLSFPHATTLSGGGYAVTWLTGADEAMGYLAQAFDSDGTRVGEELRVNDENMITDVGTFIATEGDGFMAAWSEEKLVTSNDGGAEQRYTDVLVRMFDVQPD